MVRGWEVVCIQLEGKMADRRFTCWLQQFLRWLYRRQNRTLLRDAKNSKRGSGHKWQQGMIPLAIRKTSFIGGELSTVKISPKSCRIWNCSEFNCESCEYAALTEARPTLNREWNQVTSRDPFQPKLFSDSNHIFKIKVQGHFQS